MKEYPKIQTIFKRDIRKNLLMNDYSTQEFYILRNATWVVTEKINGTNICIKIDKNGDWCFGNHGSQIPTNLINLCIQKFNKEIIKSTFENVNVDLYFEGYGKGIQESDGSKYSNEVNITLLDICINDIWLTRQSCEEIANKFKVDIVPFIAFCSFPDIIDLVQTGFKSKLGDLMAEGIVAKPIGDLRTRTGDRIITKLKYRDFPITERGKNLYGN